MNTLKFSNGILLATSIDHYTNITNVFEFCQRNKRIENTSKSDNSIREKNSYGAIF